MPDELTKAERALEVYAKSDPADGDEIDWPSCAARIRAARVEAGLTVDDIAARLELPFAAYDDLERYDDEPFTVASIGVLRTLGEIVGVPVGELLLGPEGRRERTISFAQVSRALHDFLERERQTADQFGDAIGWDLTPMLDDPDNWDDQNVELLYLVSQQLQVDWVAVLAHPRNQLR
jgi:transcriptional regulator with XRE-family HTH domain